MPTENLTVQIGVESKGGENLREHIRNVEETNAAWSQFNELRRDAEKQFPDNLRKQNTFMREQLGLLQQLETVETAKRLKELRDERSKIQGMRDRESIQKRSQLDKQIAEESNLHLEIRQQDIETRKHIIQWGYDKNLGVSAEDRAGGMEAMAGAGIRGGVGGMAETALGMGVSGLKEKMAGMGMGGKLALGLAGGLALGAGYAIVSGLKEGWDQFKDVNKELLDISAMSAKMPADAEKFRLEFEQVALTTATANSELAQYEKTLMRTMGIVADKSDTRRAVLNDVILAAKSWGVPEDMAVNFTASMGLTGYQGKMDSGTFTNAVAEGVASGIGVARLPAFLNEVQSFTNAVLSTSVTIDDPTLMSKWAGVFGTLGEPFRGERGGQVLGALNQMITGGGMGFQAARRVIEGEGGDLSIGRVTAMQEQGMADPRLLAEMFKMAQEIGGDDQFNQAYLLKQWSGGGLKMKQLYNPDEAINSIVELVDALAKKGTSIGGLNDMTTAGVDALTANMSDEERQYIKDVQSGKALTPEDPNAALVGAIKEGLKLNDADFSSRVASYKDTFGFIQQQADIAKEIVKIETAANTFGDAAKAIWEAQIAMGNWVTGLTGMPPAEVQAHVDRATQKRTMENAVTGGTQKGVQLSSGQVVFD